MKVVYSFPFSRLLNIFIDADACNFSTLFDSRAEENKVAFHKITVIVICIYMFY